MKIVRKVQIIGPSISHNHTVHLLYTNADKQPEQISELVHSHLTQRMEGTVIQNSQHIHITEHREPIT